MTEYLDWEDVKAEMRAASPLGDAEYAAAKAAAKERHEAYLRGYQLAEMRKTARLTQKEVARKLGVSQGRISQIESGEISGIDTIRDYIAALGGQSELIGRLGGRTWKVA